MKLSIVIALYNTEKYIEKCIRSVYKGNSLPMEEYEILVINDGSKDRSREIVESLQQEFFNIHLFNKENGGQSTARNIGFNIAKGDYIFCLDSDDSLDGEALVAALQYAEENSLDMLPVFFGIYDENSVLLEEKVDNYSIVDGIVTGGEFLNRHVISGSMWRYFYKTSIIREKNLYLTEGIYHEDEEFVVKFMSYSKRVAYQKHLVYNHIVRGDSTVNKKDRTHRIKLLNDLLVVVERLNEHRNFFMNNSLEYKGVSRKVEQLIITVFLRMKKEGLDYKETEPFINKLKTFGLYPIKINNLNVKFRMAAFFFNIAFLNKLYYR